MASTYITNGYRQRNIDETMFYLKQCGSLYTREQVLAQWAVMDGDAISF